MYRQKNCDGSTYVTVRHVHIVEKVPKTKNKNLSNSKVKKRTP